MVERREWTSKKKGIEMRRQREGPQRGEHWSVGRSVYNKADRRIYMYVCIHTYTYLYTYIHRHIDRYIYTYTYICLCVYIYIYGTLK